MTPHDFRNLVSGCFRCGGDTGIYGRGKDGPGLGDLNLNPGIPHSTPFKK